VETLNLPDAHRPGGFTTPEEVEAAIRLVRNHSEIPVRPCGCGSCQEARRTVRRYQRERSERDS